MAALELQCPAKLNLLLAVTGRRPDGFHDLVSLVAPLAWGDTLRVEAAAKLSLACDDPAVPVDDTNLVLKAAAAFRAATGWSGGARFTLTKRIPHGAGLGGGSSDAATVLKAVNQLCGSPLELEQLAEIAGSIGSDVPFFLYDSACDATGRGEIINPVSFPHELTVVLVKPPFGIPSAWAYKQWAESEELNGVLYAPQICPWGTMVNDLERPVFAKHLNLPTLKMWLLDQPETLAALKSGSGSTVFAVARSGVEAARLAERAQQWCGETSWVRVARTLPNG